MQKAFGPKDQKAFRDNYLAALLICLAITFSFGAHAQYDSTKVRQPVNGYGFDWKNGKFGSLIIPKDTPKLAIADSGGISFIGGKVWNWTGHYWKQVSGSGGGTTDSLKGLPIDTGAAANDNYVLAFDSVSRKWKLVAQLGGGSTDTTGLSNRINLKIDSIRRRVDSVFWYANGTENFAFIDSTGGGSAQRFMVVGEDDAATQTRHFNANGHDISIDFDGTGNNGILFDHTANVASLFYNIVGTGSSTVDVGPGGGELAWYDFGSSSFGDVVNFVHNGVMRLSAYKV